VSTRSPLVRSPLPRKLEIVVLIPVHNEAGSLMTTVEGLLTQSRVPDHIVILENGSTDDTAAIARTFMADSRARVTAESLGRLEHRKSEALNIGWRRWCRTADLVVCLDGDTMLPANAIGDWEREFLADPALGGSSSKFTMRGSDLLTRLQRAEFAKWTDYGLRRGWTSVLAGTGCCIRNDALRSVMGDGRSGPWHYGSQVEDFELTYRVRENGFRCQISPTVRAYTDSMKSLRALWGQRMKWQVGTVEDLLAFGVNRRTALDWRQQVAGLLSAMIRVLWLVVMVGALLIGTFTMSWVPLVITATFCWIDVVHAMRIPHRDRVDILLAMALVPQELFAWLRAGWFVAAWYEVLRSRVFGSRKDRWALQYSAEGGA
jgi:cellulose synthase/poly-beta-1,6-N-acetylglucosamine synthase-like glycosyltransferase